MAKYYFTFRGSFLVVDAPTKKDADEIFRHDFPDDEYSVYTEKDWYLRVADYYDGMAPIAHMYHYSDRKEVKTSIGEIVVDVVDDANYPGVWISFRPKGKNMEVGIALAEVCEDEGKFHLRPYISKYTHECDQNGCRVEGKISFDAPFDDRSFTLADILSEEEMYG